MKKFYWPWMLVLCAIAAHAQSPRKLDSLRTVLTALPPEGRSYSSDTMRVRVLCEVGEATTDMKESMSAFEKAKALTKEIKYSLGYCNVALMYGRTIHKNQNFYKVAEILLDGLKEAENIKSSLFIAEINYQLGTVYYNLPDFNIARKHLNTAKQKYLEIKNYLGLIKTEIFLGNIEIEQRKNMKGIAYYRNALSLSHKYKIYDKIPNAISNIGLAFEQQSQLDSALIYVDSALNVMKTRKVIDVSLMVGTLIEKAYIYYLLKDYNKSVVYGKEALSDCPPNNLDFKSYAHRVLYRAYKGNGDNSNSLKHFEQFTFLRDSLNEMSKNQQINALRASYENDKNIMALNNLTVTLDAQKYQRNVLLAFTAVILAFLFFIWQTKNKISKQKDEILVVKSQLENLNSSLEDRVLQRTQELSEANETLIRKNREIEEALFKGQSIERHRISSELHDNIGGTLSSVNWRLQALNKESLSKRDIEIYEGILSMVKEAYSDVRTLSHNLLPKVLEENGLVAAIEKLIDDLNQNDKLNFTFETNLTERIDNKKIELNTYSLILELINNILKHSQATKASISIRIEGDNYVVKVQDNGVGITQEAINNTGKGTQNIANRITLLNGEFFYEKMAVGTAICVTIPKNQQNFV
jgi:signal transduction histidine kinase